MDTPTARWSSVQRTPFKAGIDAMRHAQDCLWTRVKAHESIGAMLAANGGRRASIVTTEIAIAKLLDTDVVQTRIFAIDQIPMMQLHVLQIGQLIGKTFGFGPADQPLPFEPSMILSFQSGSMEVDGKTVIINQLGIEPTRIVLNIAGTSSSAK